MKKNLNHSFLSSMVMISMMISCFVLSGCSSEIPESQTIQKNAIVYMVGKENPFSGFVNGKVRDEYRGIFLTFKKQYKKGRLHGETIYWYPNGIIEGVERYRNGKLEGLTEKYYEDGKKKSRIHFTNGERGGSMGDVVWDRNGKTIR